ncbi:hypothetical protein [Pararhizobium capsulatum]
MPLSFSFFFSGAIGRLTKVASVQDRSDRGIIYATCSSPDTNA